MKHSLQAVHLLQRCLRAVLLVLDAWGWTVGASHHGSSHR